MATEHNRTRQHPNDDQLSVINNVPGDVHQLPSDVSLEYFYTVLPYIPGVECVANSLDHFHYWFNPKFSSPIDVQKGGCVYAVRGISELKGNYRRAQVCEGISPELQFYFAIVETVDSRAGSPKIEKGLAVLPLEFISDCGQFCLLPASLERLRRPSDVDWTPDDFKAFLPLNRASFGSGSLLSEHPVASFQLNGCICWEWSTIQTVFLAMRGSCLSKLMPYSSDRAEEIISPRLRHTQDIRRINANIWRTPARKSHTALGNPPVNRQLMMISPGYEMDITQGSYRSLSSISPFPGISATTGVMSQPGSMMTRNEDTVGEGQTGQSSACTSGYSTAGSASRSRGSSPNRRFTEDSDDVLQGESRSSTPARSLVPAKQGRNALMHLSFRELADECSELREQLSAVEKLATDGLIYIPSILRLAERINGGHLNIDVSQVVASNERDARFWNKYHFSYPIKSAKQLKMLNDLIGINREFYEDVKEWIIATYGNRINATDNNIAELMTAVSPYSKKQHLAMFYARELMSPRCLSELVWNERHYYELTRRSHLAKECLKGYFLHEGLVEAQGNKEFLKPAIDGLPHLLELFQVCCQLVGKMLCERASSVIDTTKFSRSYSKRWVNVFRECSRETIGSRQAAQKRKLEESRKTNSYSIYTTNAEWSKSGTFSSW